MLTPITRIRLVFLIGAPALVGLSLWLVGHERGRAQGSAGVISFSQPSYSVNEGGNATITLTRTGGTSNQVVAKVGISDVTTSPSDYTPPFPGRVDTTFTPTTKPGNAVRDVAIQPDGKVLYAGIQTGDSGDGLIRLNPNGMPDPSFNPAVIVIEGDALGLQPDGKILVVGFVRLTAGGPNVGMARLNSDGSLDSTFNVGIGFNEYSVNALAIQPDGKIIVGGNFPKYNGVSRPYLVRLNPDGSHDPGFAAGAGPDGEVLALALQPDGKVLIGGRFNSYDGITRRNLARLNANGSLDPTFVIPSVVDDLLVWEIAVQPDGKVLVGGIFYVGSPTDNNTTLTPLFRLNSDGTQDQSFTSTLGHKNMTRAIVIQPDGKIFVAGSIIRTPQDSLYFLNRLNADGTRDTTFSSGIVAFSNSGAYALAMQGDGKLVVGGQFTGATPAISWKFLHRLEGEMFVTWPAGDATDKTISLPTVDDSLVEPSESMTLSLSLIQGGATIGANSTASLTITDNDTQITTVSGSGVFAGTASMTATLSTFSAPLSGKTITFTLNSTNVGSAITDANGVATLTNVSLAGINAGIYQSAIIPRFAGDLSFGSSSSSGTLTVSKAAATLTVSPGSVNPSDVGQSVNFTVTATSPAGTPSGTVVIKSDGATVSTNISLNSSGIAILIATGLTTGTHNITTELNSTNFTANPSAPVSHTVKVAPTLSISDVVSIEGNVNQRIAIFTVTLTPTSAATVTVNYSTQNGTAASGSDYQSTSNSLTFSPGTSTRTIFVNINGDNTVEPDETFLVNLSVPQNATIARSPGTGFIVGDDNSPGNPSDLAGFFVRQNYVDFLSRDPDASGFQFWRSQITSCGTDAQCTEVRRIDVSASFFLSIEFQQTGYLVERFYKVAYGDASGTSNFPANHQLAVPIVRRSEFQTDTQRIGQGVVVLASGWEQLLESNKQAYALEFVQTARFGSAFPTTMTPVQFVDKLNQNAGDVLSASEKTTAINLFGGAADSSNTTARAQTVRQVAEDLDLYNAEFNRAFVLAEYFGYLRRNPNDAPEPTLDYTGYDFWLTKLNQFNGNYISAEMVKAFLSSIEYRQRFGP